MILPIQPQLIYNTLTKTKSPLEPIQDKKISLYACGVTPYDSNHLGHGMQAVFFDMIRRYLEYSGYHVTYVRNYTDVDDKIIARAQTLGIAPLDLSSQMIQEGQKEMAALGVKPGDVEPKVSEHIPQIIDMVKTLIEKGHAYSTDDGDVYFRVHSKADYGKLSRRSKEQERSGSRDLSGNQKEDPLDFALWKKDSTPGAFWPSPWGHGRPGWHIECSAMAKAHLGDEIDIHGGGGDLIFPHHENEIAQSEAANGCLYARVWAHSGLLTINKQKMSKSLGNSVTLKEALNQWPGEVLRLCYLQNHYRSPVDFHDELFRSSFQKIMFYYELIALSPSEITKEPTHLIGELADFHRAFHLGMKDDFNTPVALAQMHKLAKWIYQKHISKKPQELAQGLELFVSLGQVLGFFFQPSATEFVQKLKTKLLTDLGLSEDLILAKIQKRQEARAEKNWQKGDQIRQELLAQGILLMDQSSGVTHWAIDWTSRL